MRTEIPDVDPALDTRWRRIASRLSTWRFNQWLGRRVSPRVDPVMMRATRGRLRLSWGVRLVMLTHKGAKSGIERSTPLTYFTDASRVIIVASNYGGPRNPAWYHNVKAHPQVTITGGGYEGTFVGEDVIGAERDRLFDLAKRYLATYAAYEQTSGGRKIPVLAFTEVS